MRLDARRNDAVNASVGGPIHSNNSAVQIWVIPTDEGQVMAEAAHTLLTRNSTSEQPTLLETTYDCRT